MRPMMLNVVEPRAQFRWRDIKRYRQVILQIAHLGRIAQTIHNLTREPMTISITWEHGHLVRITYRCVAYHWERGRPVRMFLRDLQLRPLTQVVLTTSRLLPPAL